MSDNRSEKARLDRDVIQSLDMASPENAEEEISLDDLDDLDVEGSEPSVGEPEPEMPETAETSGADLLDDASESEVDEDPASAEAEGVSDSAETPKPKKSRSKAIMDSLLAEQKAKDQAAKNTGDTAEAAPAASSGKKSGPPMADGTQGAETPDRSETVSEASEASDSKEAKPRKAPPVVGKKVEENDDPFADLGDFDLDNLEEVEGDEEDDDEIDTSSLEDRSDEVLTAIIGKDADSKRRLALAYDSLIPAAFTDINHLIYSVIISRRRADMNERSFRGTLQANRKNILYSGDKVNVNSVDQVEGLNQEDSFLLAASKKYGRLFDTTWKGTDEDFDLLVEDYIQEFAEVKSAEKIRTASEIVKGSVKMGRRVFSGTEDAQTYLTTELTALNDLKDKTRGSGLKSLSEVRQEIDTRKANKKLAGFDMMPSLDKAFNGIRSGLMYVMMAPPKGGKTRFTVDITHNALVKHGTNVLVWPTEGGVNLFTPLLSAKHYHYSINKDRFGTNNPLLPGIDASDIRNNTLDSRQKVYEQTFFTELTSNPNYGVCTMVDNGTMYVEDFTDILKDYVRRTKSEIVIIDYLALIQSNNPRNTDKVQILNQAFQKAAQFAHEENVALITPHQYRQEAVRAMAQGGDLDMRVEGAGSAEVLRSTDMGLAMWASSEMLQQGRMELRSLPTRYAAPFDPIPLSTDLGSSYFCEIKEDDE